jgi:nitrogenase molybdenum-iron protein alpha chain
VPVRCEGFRGVSQSLGHHIANDAIRDWVLDKRDGQPFEATPYDVAIIGDYNIGGDAWSSRILLEEMGLRVVAQWSGDGTLAEIEKTPKVKLNLLHCYRSMNYISRHMEEKYGIPWLEYNFFGPTKIAESLRDRRHFDDTIKEGAERVIAKYQPMMEAVIAKYKPRLQGQDGDALRRRPAPAPRHRRLRGPRHGGHRHRLRVRAQRRLRPHHQGNGQRHPALRRRHRLRVRGVRQAHQARPGRLRHQGESTSSRRWASRFRQMHSWDYSGPYHGYDGFAIFARDMDMAINNPCWKQCRRPGRKKSARKRPLLKAPARAEEGYATNEPLNPALNLARVHGLVARAKEMKMQTVDDIKPCYPLFRERRLQGEPR